MVPNVRSTADSAESKYKAWALSNPNQQAFIRAIIDARKYEIRSVLTIIVSAPPLQAPIMSAAAIYRSLCDCGFRKRSLAASSASCHAVYNQKYLYFASVSSTAGSPGGALQRMP